MTHPLAPIVRESAGALAMFFTPRQRLEGIIRKEKESYVIGFGRDRKEIPYPEILGLQIGYTTESVEEVQARVMQDKADRRVVKFGRQARFEVEGKVTPLFRWYKIEDLFWNPIWTNDRRMQEQSGDLIAGARFTMRRMFVKSELVKSVEEYQFDDEIIIPHFQRELIAKYSLPLNIRNDSIHSDLRNRFPPAAYFLREALREHRMGNNLNAGVLAYNAYQIASSYGEVRLADKAVCLAKTIMESSDNEILTKFLKEYIPHTE